LELMQKVDTVVVDKTGTLTEGRPRLVVVEAAPGFDGDDVLRRAASLEKASEHPLAAAIVAGARERGVTLPQVEDFSSITGKGVRGKVDGLVVLAGTTALMEEQAIDVGALIASADVLRREGH